MLPEEKSIIYTALLLQSFSSRITGKVITERNYCNIKSGTLFLFFLLLTFIYNVFDNNGSNFVNVLRRVKVLHRIMLPRENHFINGQHSILGTKILLLFYLFYFVSPSFSKKMLFFRHMIILFNSRIII